MHSTRDVLSWPGRFRALTLGAQALVTFLPFAWAGPQAGSTAGFLAGSTLLVLPDRRRWVLYGAVGAAELLALWRQGLSAVDLTYSVYFTLLTGLMVYGVSSLARLVGVVHAARGGMARMAVMRERLRVARDLHDLLGYSISTISLKSELAYRLLPASADPESTGRARQELRDALGVARRALADVLVVADGSHPMSLAAEAGAAESTLGAAEIAVRVELADAVRDSLPEELDTALAIVLREALTNVLRHSKAEQCLIETVVDAGRVRLRVSNDGAQPPARSLGDGSGLKNLTSRMEAIGGQLSAVSEDGWFRLTAEAPLATGARRSRAAQPAAPGTPESPASWAQAWSGGQPWHLRVARNIAMVVLTGYAALIVINVLPLPLGAGALAGFAACVAAQLGVLIACSLGSPRSWSAWVLVGIGAWQLFFTVLPLLWVVAPWGSMGGFLAGSLLLVVIGPWRWALYAAVGAGVAALSAAHHNPVTFTAYLVISTFLTGLVAYGIGSLSQLMMAVDQTREELARVAVTQERLTVARNLHELLGQDLSAMVLKIQRTLRTLSRLPYQARDEVAEVLEVARRAAADIRSVAGGYRRVSFDAEVESAVATLAAGSIEARAVVPPGAVSPELDTVLAVVLREAVTNVLRHSAARSCEIEVCEHPASVRMHVTSDGAPPGGEAPVRDGSALGDLAQRLQAVGGELTAAADGGTFRLIAEVPRNPQADQLIM
jgi:signal transduction histidine kinase